MATILNSPLTETVTRALRAGDKVLISGPVYTARDAAHKRLAELIARGDRLPVALKGQIIYYTGPTPPAPGRPVGSAGPTTSSRMDAYTPAILSQGVLALIGKGERSAQVEDSLHASGAVYLAAAGGAGALLAERIIAAEPVAYPELGPEAIFRLQLDDFPAIVAIDSSGGNLYRLGRKQYRKQNHFI